MIHISRFDESFSVTSMNPTTKRNMKLTALGATALALTFFVVRPLIGADGKPNGHGHDRPTASALWQKAADLQKKLSAEEKARLLNNTEMRGPRGEGFGGKGGFRPEHADPLGAILTADQKSKVDAIRSSYKSRFEALEASRKSNSITDDAFRTQMKSLHESMRSEVESVLTVEQKAKMEEMRKSHEGMDRGMRGGRGEGMDRGMRGEDRPIGPPGRPGFDPAQERDAMATALGLTADQKSAIEKLMIAHRAEVEAAMKNSNGNREEMRGTMEAMRTKHQAAFAAILNPTQLEIVKIHDALMRHGAGCGPHMKGDRRPEGETSPQTPSSTPKPGNANIE
jgi:hypothetical protein